MHEVLSRPDLHIERHSSELEGEPLVKPYWDPSLDPSTARGRVRLIGLLRKLVVMGIVIGVKRKNIDAALFFVAKKGGWIRMIVDGRQPNSFHRLPPHASMASVVALSALRIGAQWKTRCDVADPVESIEAGSVDFQDGFH